MGNGPGNIKEYIDAFYKYPKLQGGFAWEWANHGLLTKNNTSGEEYYVYGGNFGESVHDSTFVMDGLLNSDHKPNPGLIEYKKAIEPVQFLEVNENRAKFINRYDFNTLDHLACSYTVVSASEQDKTTGELEIPSTIGPGESFDLDLPSVAGGEDEDETLLNLSFRLKEATPFLDQGFEVSTAQIPLKTSTLIQDTPPIDEPLNIETTTNRNTITIGSSATTWTFNTVHGHLTSILHGSKEKELISSPPTLSIYRAQTDNDIRSDGQDWNAAYLHVASPATRKVDWSPLDPSTFTITVSQRIAPLVLSWSIDCVLTYTFKSNGTLGINVAGTPKGENLPRTIPRIGFVMELPKDWKKVEWFGRGPGETYRDSKSSQLIGTHAVDDVDELWTDYEVPQESSNRTDTRWLKLSNDESSLFVQFAGPSTSDASTRERKTFDFQASHYRMRDVAEAKHPYELRRLKREEVVLRLDSEHHGLGSGSCGPRTRDEYALFTEAFEFEIVMGWV
jgi:beta-galactosidase